MFRGQYGKIRDADVDRLHKDFLSFTTEAVLLFK
jgi:hypothetical protein